MLIKFTVENYLSIKERVVLNLSAASSKERYEENVFENNELNEKLLKGMAIMGPNSGGKSNLIKALSFVKDFVLNSFDEVRANERIDIEKYKLSTDYLNKPSHFEIEFIADERKFRYGFKVDESEIHSEWLYYSLKTVEKQYFFRSKDGGLVLSNSFREGWERKELLRPNALFLTTVAQLNGSISKIIFKWFQNVTVLSDTDYLSYINLTAKKWEEGVIKNYVKKLLINANLGFEDVEIKQIKNDLSQYSFLPDEIKRMIISRSPYQYQISTIHKVYNDKGIVSGGLEMFDLRKDESQGTQKFFSLLGPIIDSLIEGKLLLIDELDARLHPNLAIMLVELFNSKNENRYGAQMIFSSHNSLILKKKSLRRDQISMVYKKAGHGTRVENYQDLNVRTDSAYDLEYLNLEERLAQGVRDTQYGLFN